MSTLAADKKNKTILSFAKSFETFYFFHFFLLLLAAPLQGSQQRTKLHEDSPLPLFYCFNTTYNLLFTISVYIQALTAAGSD